MKPLRFLGALLLTVVAHVLTERLGPAVSQAFDFFLVLTVINAVSGSSLAGMLGGTVAGLTEDTLSGNVFGLYGFAATILGYAAARVSQRLVLRRASGVLLLIAAAVLLQAVILLGISALALPQLLLPDPLWLVIRAGCSGVLGALLYTMVSRWQQGADTRRQRRTRRLKLGLKERD